MIYLHNENEVKTKLDDPVVIRWRSLGVRRDGVEHFLLLWSNGKFEDRWAHISENLPYWQFKRDAGFGHPPPYDPELRR